MDSLIIPISQMEKLKLAGGSRVAYKRFHCQEVAELGFEPVPLCLQSLQAHSILLGGIWRLFGLYTYCKMT